MKSNCKNELISIVLPVFNGERFLRQAMESIVRQTYENFELIVVNDCSTDGTLEIIKEFMQRDNRIRLINNKLNQKLPKSLNIGFAEARGSYYTWTSDDNCYNENAIEIMYQYMEEHPLCGMVYADMQYIDENMQIIGENHSDKNDIYLYNCVGACFLYKSQCREVVGDYDAERILVEDYDYWLRIAQVYELGHIDKKLYRYRYHTNSLTATRQRQIGEQLAKLKIDNLDFLLGKISKEERCPLLFELMVCSNGIDEDTWTQILKRIEVNEDIEWIKRKRKKESEKKIWIFGAGAMGRVALYHLGFDAVSAFVDNASEKVGTYIEGKRVNSFEELRRNSDLYHVVIAMDIRKAYFVARQLEENGIQNYSLSIEL